MAIDSSALVDGVKPLDIAGAINKGNTALQGQITTEAMQQEAGDKQVVRDLSSVPGVDFSTPKGIREFMGHLQGRVAPETIMKLGDMSTKMETAEAARVSALAKQSTDQRKTYEDGVDTVTGILGGVLKEPDVLKQRDAFKAQIANMREEKLPNGEPVYPAAVLDHLDKVPQAQWGDLYKGSSHAKELSLRAKEQAETDKAEALAAESKNRVDNPDLGKQYISPSNPGKAYFQNKRGQSYMVDANTGERTSIPAMPGDVRQAASAASIKDSDAVKMKPETLEWIAEYEQRTGKPIPGIPAGTGAAATNTRTEYLNAFVRVAKEKGYTGEQAGEEAIVRDASKEAMKSLVTKNANIIAGEKDLMKVADVIDGELKKLGGPDSPVVRKFWDKASTEWEGDPQFMGLRAALVNFKETAARVYSNQTGAGGTPVTYLKLAEDSIGSTPTLEQFSKTREVMTKLFKAREDSNRETLMELRAQGRLTDKRSAEVEAEPKAVNTESGGPAVMPGASPDAREELKRARQVAAAETDPQKKAMAVAAALALEKQIAGGDKPTIAEGTEKPSKSGKPMIFKGGKWVYKQ